MDENHTAPNIPVIPVSLFRNFTHVCHQSGFAPTELDRMLPIEPAFFEQPDFSDSVDISSASDEILDYTVVTPVESSDERGANEDIKVAANETFTVKGFTKHEVTSDTDESMHSYNINTVEYSSVTDDNIFVNRANKIKNPGTMIHPPSPTIKQELTDDTPLIDTILGTDEQIAMEHGSGFDESHDEVLAEPVDSVVKQEPFNSFDRANKIKNPGTMIHPPSPTIKQELTDDTPLIDTILGTDEQIAMEHGSGFDESHDEVLAEPVDSVVKQEPFYSFDTLLGTLKEHENIKEEPTDNAFGQHVEDLNAINTSCGVSRVSEHVWFEKGAAGRGNGALKCQSCSVFFKDRIEFLDHMFFCKGRNLCNNSPIDKQEVTNMNQNSMVNNLIRADSDKMEVKPRMKGRTRKLSPINDDSKAMPEARISLRLKRQYNGKSTGLAMSGCLYRYTIGNRAADFNSNNDALNNHLMGDHSKCTEHAECTAKYFCCHFQNCAFRFPSQKLLARHITIQHERKHCDRICAYKRPRIDRKDNHADTMKDSIDSTILTKAKGAAHRDTNKTLRALLQKKIQKEHPIITKAIEHKVTSTDNNDSLKEEPETATPTLTRPTSLGVFKCCISECQDRVFFTKHELKSHIIVEHPQRMVPKVFMPVFSKAEQARLINSKYVSLDGKKFLNALTKVEHCYC